MLDGVLTFNHYCVANIECTIKRHHLADLCLLTHQITKKHNTLDSLVNIENNFLGGLERRNQGFY